jgi:DNA replication protein DnaC
MTDVSTWGPKWAVAATDTKECGMEKGHPPYPRSWMKHEHLKNPPFWTNCPACNLEWEAEAKVVDAQARGGASADDSAKLQAMALANIPKRYRGLSVFQMSSPYPQQRAFKSAVLTYSNMISQNVDRGIGLSMSGETGTGKTHVACCILQAAMDKGGTALYTTATDMVDAVSATYGGKGSKEAAIEAYVTPDLLALDELGRESGEEHSKNLIFRVLDKRNHDRKPTIICTNLDAKALLAYLGAPMVDRLKEGGAKFLRLQWPSMRGTDYQTGAE